MRRWIGLMVCWGCTGPPADKLEPAEPSDPSPSPVDTQDDLVITDTADLAAPVVVRRRPEADAVGVEPGADIEVHFDETIDESTLGSSSFVLLGADEHAVPATVYAYGDFLELVPETPLDWGETWTAVVTGVADRHGNVMEEVRWSFQVAQSWCTRTST